MKKRIIAALLSVAMLTILCTPVVSADTYTVQKGDNLSAIAARILGKSSRWKEIYELNKDIIKNPNLIYVGQVLEIPGTQPTTPTQPSKPVLPAQPEYGANPEYPLWTVIKHTDGDLVIPATVCANSDLTQFEVLFTLGDKHKMIGTKSAAGVEITYSRVEIMAPFAIPMVEAALAQNIWLPVAECPLAYVDPAAEDNKPLYLRAGVWEEDFDRANDNLNGLLCQVKDETVAAYKTKPAAADKKGTVDTLEYKTGDGTAYAYVYLPASYDKAKEYNVLYLLHGGGGNAASWFTNTDADDAGFKDGDDITNDLSYAVNILDNMFANGDAEPCIVVTPNASDIQNFGTTLRDLIAEVDKSYSTKADRENRALAGLSMGSMATWSGGIVSNLDNISWFANMSGGPIADVAAGEAYTKESVIPALDAAAAKGNKINMMLSLNGVFDMALPPHVATHKLLVEYAENSDVLEVGENYDFLVSDGAHDWDAWNLYLYDVLSVFFRDQSDKSGLPAKPEYGANPEYPLWTVVEHTEAGFTFPVTVCANSDLTQFEILFSFFGDSHKMTGTKSAAGVEITYSRVSMIADLGVPMVEAALAQNIWLPVAECPLEYVDPAAHDNDPPYLQAGVWEDEFERKNDNLNGLPYQIKDETIAAYKTKPAAADKKGTVDTLEYKTGDGTAYAYVYLPAGYDEAKEYNVLYLIHGGGGNAASWFTNTDADDAGFNNGDDITNGLSYAVNILDNMFANGDAEPCIVVTPNASEPQDFNNFGQTLRDLIATVDETYSTKADRENRAMAGLSMGSIATWKGGIVDNLDNISWFGNMSAAPSADVAEAEAYVKESVIPALDAAAAKGYNINMMLSFNGTLDMALKPHVATHKILVEYAESSDVLEVGENYDFLVSNGSHAWDAWNLYLYDVLTVFFR